MTRYGIVHLSYFHSSPLPPKFLFMKGPGLQEPRSTPRVRASPASGGTFVSITSEKRSRAEYGASIRSADCRRNHAGGNYERAFENMARNPFHGRTFEFS